MYNIIDVSFGLDDMCKLVYLDSLDGNNNGTDDGSREGAPGQEDLLPPLERLPGLRAALEVEDSGGQGHHPPVEQEADGQRHPPDERGQHDLGLGQRAAGRVQAAQL